jgi:hypothetical protein
MADAEHPSAAERFLAALTANGVRFFFGNAGTDFPPIIEALAKAAETGDPLAEARRKLDAKGLDLIVANDVLNFLNTQVAAPTPATLN